MLATDLTSLMIERVAIAVVRGWRNTLIAPVIFDVAQLAIVGDVAPHEVAPLSTPGRAFVPLPPVKRR